MEDVSFETTVGDLKPLSMPQASSASHCSAFTGGAASIAYAGASSRASRILSSSEATRSVGRGDPNRPSGEEQERRCADP